MSSSDSHGERRSVGALIALAAGTFSYVTTENLPIGLLLPIAADLDVSHAAVGRLVTWYGLVVVAVTIPLTHLTRRLPRRWLMSGLLTAFVVTTWASAVADSYPTLLACRLLTAVSQAVFWSITIPIAAGLFPPRLHGRAIAVALGGSSVAIVLGVPAGTWLGQRAGWRVSFLVLGAVGLLTLLAVAVLLPSGRPGSRPTTINPTPDPARYWTLVAVTAVAVTGLFTSYTYVAPFLTEVSGFSAAAIGPVLFLTGLVGAAGVAAGGALTGRAWATIVGSVGTLAVMLTGLYLFGGGRLAAVVLLCLSEFSVSVFVTALNTVVLRVAPGNVDLASAGVSTAFNVGITGGAFLGSVLLPGAGVRTTALAGGLLAASALVILTAPTPSRDFRRVAAERGWRRTNGRAKNDG